MSATVIRAERGWPYRICRNGPSIVLTRDGRTRPHTIAFTTTDAYRIANALVDMAEQTEQDN
ncbi:Uncharacterised protein [Mycobacteroides abscessus subsp. abscessus]|nr:Uncharacterised protein [Mycobacteroides abscessus subsp. abscessus]SLK74676.1 Uncharacterised protein [Mycobacteroides abscessus subsp. abscessus]